MKTVSRLRLFDFVWGLGVYLFILLTSCSKDEIIEVDQCSEIHEFYSQLIREQAIQNGWDPSLPIYVNTDDPLNAGFLDITYDPNLNLYLRAFWKYINKYHQASEVANCY